MRFFSLRFSYILKLAESSKKFGVPPPSKKQPPKNNFGGLAVCVSADP